MLRQYSSEKELVCAAAGNKSGDTIDDEPEAAVLLVACAIGLATGGGVVVFNNVIHTIRHYAWQVKYRFSMNLLPSV